jgi:hypothetical protein
VELWGGDGRLLAEPEAYALFLRRMAQERVRTVRRVAREEGEAPERSALPYRRRALSEWLEKHPGGGWWAFGVTHENDGHVLAAHGGEVLTGDEAECADWLVYTALRVFPPTAEGRP